MTTGYLKVSIALLLLVAVSGIVSGASLTPAFTYQGRLTDPAGNPLTGTYFVTFRLYDVSAGGTALQQNTQTVNVVNGLFTTQVLFTQGYYDGQGLWLGVTVGADPEMTPRQVIRPVPYALSLRPGALIAGTGTLPTLDLMNTGGGKGLNISTAAQNGRGVQVSTTGTTSIGVYATTTGSSSDGVYAFTTGPYSEGITVLTSGSGSEGVLVTTTNSDSHGVSVSTYGTNSSGLTATTYNDDSPGVTVETNGQYCHGVLIDTGGEYSRGIRIDTGGTQSYGIEVSTSGYYGTGITVDTNGEHSQGIQSHTYGDSSYGAYVSTSGMESDGIQSFAHGPGSRGIYAYSEKDNAIYADSGNTSRYGLYTPDYIYAHGTKMPSSDVAEYMQVRGDAPAGTVLIIGDTGVLEPAATPYDTRVAGIVSTDPGVVLGAEENDNEGEALIAVAGRVPCRVDASSGAIHPGDLLTTSDTPGHAMKAEPIEVNGRSFYPSGIVLGKAMGTLESGTGTIEVLVTLQ